MKTGSRLTLTCMCLPLQYMTNYIYFVRFADRDTFMRFRGGGVGHTVTRDWDELLQSDCRGFREKRREGNRPGRDEEDNGREAQNRSDAGDEEGDRVGDVEGNEGLEGENKDEDEDQGDEGEGGVKRRV